MEKSRQTAFCDSETCDVRMVHLDRVVRARAEAIDDDDLVRLTRIYKIMGDPTRLKIIIALRGGEMCVCDIAAFLGLSESAVSHQLRRMRELAVVKPRREGQVLYYRIDDDHVESLVAVGLDHVREP